MARSDLLRQLFLGYSRGDDGAFRSTAGQIIADERRKQHHLLADELERAINRDLRPGAVMPLTLRPLPKGRDDRPLLRLSKPEWRFDDLMLAEDTSVVLHEIAEENLHRATLAGHGLRPRQRVLLSGLPGMGKTASAHAIATELSMPVATASLVALTASLLGETARNIEAVLAFAEQTACVLVFDEFDVLAQERDQSRDHGEIRRVAAAVLQLMEGFRGESLVVATSNHPQLLDTAVWRRFDDVVTFTALSQRQSAQLMELKLRGYPHRVDSDRWVRRLADASPADIERVCYDAIRRAILADSDRVTDIELGDAVSRYISRRTTIRDATSSSETAGRADDVN
jgi:SpoVK/Ycf46/Vps4 family AAA+-type ATPase